MNTASNANYGAAETFRVLVVEDEALVAENIRSDLVDAGFEVVGVAVRLEIAMRFIKETEFDAAILDANLAGVSAVQAAIALSERRLPFIVLSGYAHEQLPKEYSYATYIQKPYRISELIGHLKSLSTRKQTDSP